MPFQEFDVEGIKFTIDTSAATASVNKLIADIERLNDRLEDEKDFMRAGVVSQDQYAEAAKRLREQLVTKAVVLKDVAGVEAAGTGFAGVTAGVFKAERAFTALTTGHGLARAAPMLESVLSAIGGPSGLGFAFVALEMAIRTVIPMVEKFFESLDSEKVKEVTEALEKAVQAATALESTPTMAAKTTASAVSKAITDRGTPLIEAQVEQGLIATTTLESHLSPEDQQQLAIARRTGPGGLAGMMAARTIRDLEEKARTARAQQAKAFVGQLPTDRGTRDTLRQMAAAQPGLFGRGFLTELGLAEPEAQAEQRQIIASETGAGKEMQTARDKMKAKIKRDKEWDRTVRATGHMLDQEEKENRRDFDKAVKEAADIHESLEREAAAEKKRGNIAEANMKLKADREAELAAAKAARAAEQDTPDARNRRRMEVERNAMMARMQALDLANRQQGGQAASPEFLHHATSQAIQNVDLGFTIAAAVNMAIQQTRDKIAADFNRSLMRQAEVQAALQQNMMGGGNGMMNPTVLAR